MNPPLRPSFVLALLAASLIGATSAQAVMTFNLSNVGLSGTAGGSGSALGTLTGSFTTNDALSAIVSYDITASASGAFLGYHYTSITSTVSASVLPSQYFQLDSAGNVDELRLYFTSSLTATGTTLSSVFSYEHEPSGGNRFPSGAVTPAPEPSALATLGLGAMAVLRRRKRA